MIDTIEELAVAIGCADHVDSISRVGAKASVRRAVFKGTECGCVFDTTRNHILIAGYAEGVDAECPPHILQYPFELDDFWAALECADMDGCDLFHEVEYDE